MRLEVQAPGISVTSTPISMFCLSNEAHISGFQPCVWLRISSKLKISYRPLKFLLSHWTYLFACAFIYKLALRKPVVKDTEEMEDQILFLWNYGIWLSEPCIQNVWGESIFLNCFVCIKENFHSSSLEESFCSFLIHFYLVTYLRDEISWEHWALCGLVPYLS